MHKAEYAKYRASDAWRQRRIAALQRAGFRCQLCNAGNTTLDVHHRTYERVGNEKPGDLVVLCHDCHGRHHGFLPPSPPLPKSTTPAKKKPRPPSKAALKKLRRVIADAPEGQTFTTLELATATSLNTRVIRIAMHKLLGLDEVERRKGEIWVKPAKSSGR